MKVYWLSQPASDMPQDSVWLSEGELVVFDRLHIPKRRADWRLGRWTAKLAISAYLGRCRDFRHLAEVEVWPAPSGAPEAFLRGRPAGVSLSLSHTGGIAFCAVAAACASVGCDVERVEPHGSAFVSDYFTPEEQELVARCPGERRDALLTLLWSAKESALKALGCGLRADTRSVAVMPRDGALSTGATWHSLAATSRDGVPFHGWWRQTGVFVWTLVSGSSLLEPVALTDPSV